MRLGMAAAVVGMMTAVASAEPLMPLEVAATIAGDTRDVVVFVDGKHLWFPIASLCERRLCPAPGMVRDEVGYVDLSTQREQLRYTFDEDKATLAIKIDPDALPVTELRLASLAPAGLEYPTAPSLFVNYAASASYGLGIDNRVTGFGFGEAGFAAGHTLTYASVTAASEGQVVRGLSSITIDRPDVLRRYTIGDDVVIGGLLGGSGVLGGIHLSRDFSLDPYFVAQPSLTQSGVVSAPATVEIYRDGQLVRREIIPAGPFRIQDLTNSSNADTRVVVKDPFGATQMVMTTQILPPAGALRPGLSQYDYSIGFARQMLATSSFSYGEPAALFVHRLGITNALTLGARVEGTLDRASAGGTALFAHDRLNLELTGAASVAETGPSAAGAVDIGWRLPNMTVAVLGRLVGRHYATIDLGPRDDRAIGEVGGLIGWSPRPNMTASAQLSFQHRATGEDRVHASVATGFMLGSMRASLSAGMASSDINGHAFDATFTLSRSLGARTTGAVGATHDGSGNALLANISHSPDQNRGVGFEADARIGDTSSGHAIVDAEHGYGRAEATLEWMGSTGRATMTAAGGLVAVGGRVVPTRPVQGGFVLVRVPGAANVRTYLDNHLVGTTDSDGDLVIPDLAPFYANRVRVDVRDLPFDVSTTELERLIGPPRRGGAVVEFAAAHTSLVTGTVVLPGVDLSFGDLALDEAFHAPIGHHGKFELDAIVKGHHRARVELDTIHCSFEFDVGDAAVVDLHQVRCTP